MIQNELKIMQNLQEKAILISEQVDNRAVIRQERAILISEKAVIRQERAILISE